MDEDLERLESDPYGVRAKAYDVVWNGIELGGGSIRIHRPDVQARVFTQLGMSAEEARARFGFLLDALAYGAPPHGGIALGLDRMAMLLCGASSLRDVIAFPKTQRATCLMTDAPSPVDPRQLRELGIRVSSDARLERRHRRARPSSPRWSRRLQLVSAHAAGRGRASAGQHAAARRAADRARAAPADGAAGAPPPSDDAGLAVTAQIYRVLADQTEFRFVADLAVSDVLATPTVRRAGGVVERAVALGKEVGADGVIFGRVFRFHKRVGTEYGASEPASVWFELGLVSVSSGEVVWTGPLRSDAGAADLESGQLVDVLARRPALVQRQRARRPGRRSPVRGHDGDGEHGRVSEGAPRRAVPPSTRSARDVQQTADLVAPVLFVRCPMIRVIVRDDALERVEVASVRLAYGAASARRNR